MIIFRKLSILTQQFEKNIIAVNENFESKRNLNYFVQDGEDVFHSFLPHKLPLYQLLTFIKD